MDDEGRTETALLPTSALRWERLAIDATECTSVDDLLGRIDGEVARSLHETACPVQLGLKIEGRTAQHHEWHKEGSQVALEEAVQELLEGHPVALSLDRLTLATAPALDLTELRRGQDFLGDCLRALEALRNDPAKASELLAAQSLYSKPSLKKHLDPPTEASLRELLDAAEGLCLDSLLEGEG
jgi:hypothetical protein